jgi:hypothetical protein
MVAKVTVECPEVARAFGNALAFLPARSQIPYALITLSATEVTTAATDKYAVGTDRCPVSGSLGLTGTETALVDKKGLEALDRAAREGKKAPGTLTLRLGTLEFHGEGEPVTVETFDRPDLVELYDTVRGIIDAAEGRPPVIPGVLLLDPGLWSRFAKVKADKTQRVADLYMSAEYEPVLIKIGPTFKGLLMPVERQTHSDNIGQDGLW